MTIPKDATYCLDHSENCKHEETNSGWEERFDKKFGKEEVMNFGFIVKDFIRSELSLARQEERERAIRIITSTPIPARKGTATAIQEIINLIKDKS